MTNEQKYKTTESEEEPKSCPFCGGMTEIITDDKRNHWKIVAILKILTGDNYGK